MKLGTKSIFLGAHQFILHPVCLAIAWRRLYGFPWQWQLWACFLFHDLGYWGKGDIDGADGTRHPELGADLVGRMTGSWEWYFFCLCHSRTYAKRMNRKPSRLCVADKLAFVITPRWFYLWGTGLTGELSEYMANGRNAKAPPCTRAEVSCLHSGHPQSWHVGLRSYMLRWVARHHHDQNDGWTHLENGG